MLQILNTYKSILFSLLLASYLLSVFQVPVLELFHLLSHTHHHISSSTTEFHSYNSHHDHDDHNHRILNLLNDTNSQSDNHTNTSHDLELKKKVEINSVSTMNTIVSLLNNANNFGNLIKAITVYRAIVVPPPQSLHFRL